jgi:DNA-binding transcriptional ArsR family regulator
MTDSYLQAGLDALGDASRMAIFQKLSGGPLAVNELARTLPISRPAVSQHLKVLKNAGLVLDSRAGTRRLYQLSTQPRGRSTAADPLRADVDQSPEQLSNRRGSAADWSQTWQTQQNSI